MSLSRATAATLVRSHVAYTTEETERPVTRVPYRMRSRRFVIGYIAFSTAVLALAILLPVIGSY